MLKSFGNDIKPYYSDERDQNTHQSVGEIVWCQYGSRLDRYRVGIGTIQLIWLSYAKRQKWAVLCTYRSNDHSKKETLNQQVHAANHDAHDSMVDLIAFENVEQSG